MYEGTNFMSLSIRFILVFTLFFSSLQSFYSYATSYGCKKLIEEIGLSPKILGKVKNAKLQIGDKQFAQGDRVDYYLKSKFLPEKPSLAQAVPVGHSAIFVGTFSRSGKTMIVLDLGKGVIKTVPEDEIERVEFSTAHVLPSKGGVFEKAINISRISYELLSQLFLPNAVGAIPTLTAILGTGYVGNEALEFAWQFSQNHTMLAAGTGVLIAAASAIPQSRKAILGLGKFSLKGVWHTSKFAGRVLKFGISVPFKLGQIVGIGKRISGLSILRILDVKTRKGEPIPFEDRGAVLTEADGVRMFAVPSENSTNREAFVTKANSLFESALAVKRYLNRIGLPDINDKKVSVWFIENKFLGLSGPLAAELFSTIVITPIEATWWQTLIARMKGVSGFPSAENRTISDIWRDEIVGHEMVHMVIEKALKLTESEPLGTFIHEFMADYFSASALNLRSPIIGEGLINGHNMREGFRKTEYSREENRWLNYNSPAQIKGEPHKDSQVLFRLMWDIRAEFGRDALDPLIAGSIQHFDKIWKTDFFLNTPVANGNEGDVLAALGHIKESYVFLASLLAMVKKKNDIPQETLLRKAEEFGFSAETIEYLSKILG